MRGLKEILCTAAYIVKMQKIHGLEHDGEKVGKEYIKMQKEEIIKSFITLNSTLHETTPQKRK